MTSEKIIAIDAGGSAKNVTSHLNRNGSGGDKETYHGEMPNVASEYNINSLPPRA